MTNSDRARGVELAHVGAGMHADDSIRWHPALRVDKYDDEQTDWVSRKSGVVSPLGTDFEALRVKPYEVTEVAGNLLTTAGLQRLTNLLIGAGGQALTNTAARIGVGNSSTAAAVGQTDLQAAAGSTNRWFQPMDATFPTAVNGVVTLRSTFATGDGNFVWAEVGTDIGTPTVTAGNTVNATLLNRFVQALGTKASGSWVLTETITIS
jgi:hypothetical protein